MVLLSDLHIIMHSLDCHDPCWWFLGNPRIPIFWPEKNCPVKGRFFVVICEVNTEGLLINHVPPRNYKNDMAGGRQAFDGHFFQCCMRF